jgi:hypothetical protein
MHLPEATIRPACTSLGSRAGIFALSAGLLAFFHRLLDPAAILIQRDAFRLQVPLRAYLIERVRAGEFPLWYPYDALGRPFIDTGVSAVFHPWTLLFLAFDPYTAYKVAAFASCALGAAGAFLLARRLGATAGGALVAGLVQGLSGYCVSLTDNLQYLVSPTLLPLFLAALDAAVDSRRHLVAAATLWACPFLIGDPQGGMLFGALALAWAVWRHPRARASRVACAALLAALLSAAQLVPLWHAFKSSARFDPALFRNQAMSWSTSPLRLLQLATAPNSEALVAEPVAQGIFESGPWGYWARSIYLGMPVLGLAALALRHRGRQLWPLGAVALGFVLLALGSRGLLYEMLYRFLPLWSAFRYPEKMIGFATAPIALLAGLGVSPFLDRGRPLGWLAVAGAALGAAAFLLLARHFGYWHSWQPLLQEALEAILWSSVLLAAMGLLSALLRRQKVRPALAAAALAALVFFDLARVNASAYRTGPREIAEFTPPLLEALRRVEGPDEALGRYRLLSIRSRRVGFPRSLGEELGADAQVVAVRQALDQEHNGSFHIESPAAYLPGEAPALKALLMDGPLLGTLGHFNVKYLIGSEAELRRRGQASTLVATLPGFDLALISNPEPVKPRAYLARRALPVEAPLDWKRTVEREDFQRGDLDFVELHGQTLPGELGQGDVKIERYRPEAVDLSYLASGPALLVLADGYDAAWEARLDGGQHLDVLRANGLVRAALVPEGSHRVEFRYRPTRVLAGIVLSLVGLALAAALVAFPARSAKRDHAASTELEKEEQQHGHA